jgi:hypothetical protein
LRWLARDGKQGRGDFSGSRVRTGLAIVTALVATAVLLWLGFRAADGERYRALVLDRLGERVGATVTAGGNATFTLLPRPALAVEGIASGDGRFSAARLQVLLDPFSLLSPEPRVAGLRLSGVQWQPPAVQRNPFAGDWPDTRVTDLTVRLAGGDGVTRTLAVREASIARSASGSAANIRLVLPAPGGEVRIAASLGALNAGTLPATVSADLPGGAQLRLSGVLGWSDGGAVLSGRLQATGDDPAPVLGPAYARQALRAEAQAELSFDRAIVNDLRFSVGDLGGAGAVSFALGTPSRFDLALQINRLDLARLLPALPQWADAPRWDGLSGDVDVSVAAIAWRDGVMQQAKLELDITDGAINVRRASVLLPGGSDLALSGALSRESGALRFDGQVDAGADNLRALLEWLGADLDGIPGDRLRRGQMKAQVSYQNEVLGLADLDLRLDSSRLSGAAAVALRARPSFSVDLRADRLNLNGYDFAALSGRPEAPLSILSRFDTDFRLRVGALAFASHVAERAAIDARLYGGRLDLGALSAADFEGAALDASGAVTIAPSGAAVIDLRLSAHGDSFRTVMRRLGSGDVADLPDRPFSLSAQVTADPRRVSLADGELAVDDARLSGDVEMRDSGTPPARIGGRLAVTPAMLTLLPSLATAVPKIPGEPEGAIAVYDDGDQPVAQIESGGGVLRVGGR